MSKEKLNNLIDKVIGKVGPLRAPAYWMNKLFKDIGDNINNIEKNLGSLKGGLEIYVDEKVDAKADKMPIEYYASWLGLQPNVYTTYNISSTSSATIELANITDSSTYNEYIIEIKCTSTPSSVVFKDFNDTEVAINWANGIPPTFEAGNTYLVSIVNGLGLYTQFLN